MEGIFKEESRFKEEFDIWYKNKRFSRKRLWVSLRVYLKLGSPMHEYFQEGLEENECESIIKVIGNKDNLKKLELPGDIWNMRFFSENCLKPILIDLGEYRKTNSGKSIRKAYEKIGEPEEYYPEQFDVSFHFTPRMCDRELEKFCPFRKNGISKLCWEKNCSEGKGEYCPVLLFSCGYEYECNPDECPVVEGLEKNLCEGCS